MVRHADRVRVRRIVHRLPTVFLRLLTSYWFLHAGVTKYAFVSGEAFDAAGWLANGTGGSLIHGFFVLVAETPWLLTFTNLASPPGETLIGIALIVGVFTRLAAFWGVPNGFFYLGIAEWVHGSVNCDLFGLLMFVIVGTLAAGRIFGLDTMLERTAFVRRHPAMNYLLG